MSHIGWPKLLPLALKLRSARAVLGTGHSFAEFADDSDARAVLDTLEAVSNGQWGVAGRPRRSDADADREGPAIDAYFTRVWKDLSAQTAHLAGQDTLASQLLSGLEGQLCVPVCRDCCGGATAAGAPVPCRWTTASEVADADAMATRGKCLEPVGEVFSFVRDSVADAYEEACGRRLPTRIELATGHDDFNDELELAVNASTAEGDEAPPNLRVVALAFNVERVGVAEYLSLPYLLFHECLAHGYCGVDIQDTDAELSKPFHEGWMDCVAMYCLEQALADGTSAYGRSAGEILRQTLSTRGIRYNTSRAAKSRDVEKWVRGEQALHTFEELIKQALTRSNRCGPLGLAGRAREYAVAFSLAINASARSHAVRGELYRVINMHYTRTDKVFAATALAKRPQVLDFIDIYISTGDAEALLNSLVAIR